MNLDLLLGAATGVALTLYLTYVLLKPERF